MAGVAISTGRVRAAGLAAGVLAVAAFVFVLYLASRTPMLGQGETPAQVEVWMMARPEPQAPPQRPQARVVDAPPPIAATAPSADPVLSQMLACFAPRGRPRPANCPPSAEAQRQPDWRTRGQLPVGRDFVGTPPIDFSAGLTRGEQLAGLQHEPPCGGVSGAVSVCARLPPPPPPSRTAIEVCEAGGLGPCRPPPPENVRQ